MQRLSSAQYPNAAIEDYAYDNVGNRVLKRGGDLETRYSYNNRNQLLYSNVYDTEKPYRETSYIYDLQGNLVNETMTGLLSEQKKIPVEEKSYEYDTLNRTSSVRIKRGEEQSTQKNLYDAQGLRCGVEENGETTNFLTTDGVL